MPSTVHVRRNSESIGARGLPSLWHRDVQSGRRAFLRLEVGADGGALVFGQVLAALTLAVVRVRQRRHEPALLLADRVRAAEHGHEAVAARAAEWPHPLGLVGAPRERFSRPRA